MLFVSNTEEYLDDLLGSLSDGEKKEEAETTAEETPEVMPEVTPEDNDASDIMDLEGTSAEDEEFLKQFEQELAGTSQDDLMQQFEQELGADQGNKEETVSDDTQALINDLDDILNGDSDSGFEEPTPDVVEEPEIQAEAEAPEGTDEDLMALLSGMTGSDELADAGAEPEIPGAAPQEPQEESEPEAGASDTSDDLFGLDGLDGLGDGGIFGDDEPAAAEESTEADEAPQEKKTGKAKKGEKGEKKKGGFLQKLSLILFGEDEEEDVLSADDENKKLLKELDAAGETDSGAVKPEDKKAKKKREKAEKQEQKKKEKEAKKAEKAQKAANKPKKEKKPKEKDNTPPLPKKPVILIAVLAISIFALIQLGSSAVGYSVFKGEAQDSYKQGDYVTAYAKLEGAKIKSADEDFYNRTALLAAIQEEYDSYQSMMQIGETEMALDCLIRGVGRCDNHAEKAEEYGVTAEVDGLKNQMTQTLTDVFGVDEQQALEVYGQRSRTDYTLELKKILKASGME